ncbi:MAG: N-acetylmuramoyl-L-alanine amidase [Saprospiraceae bacterium]
MVSDFVQKNVTILRILLILTLIVYYVSSTLHAADVKVLLKQTDRKIDLSTIAVDAASIVNSYFTPTPGKKKITKVVIDAGHGGHDPGAVGVNSREKDITLKLALLVGDMIQKKYADVEVLQTRTTDVFIPLFRRIQYANENNADLFISIHCNFTASSKVRGTETFVMGLQRVGENLEVAKRENASILLEQNYEANYDGFDPNSPEGHIMLSMYQNNYLDKSIEFAAEVEKHFATATLSKSRGVKQAGFAVLRRASMPSVLVEAGFLSNDTEEAFLLSDEGQSMVAQSITKAFDSFHKNISQQNQQMVASDQVESSGENLPTIIKNGNKNVTVDSKNIGKESPGNVSQTDLIKDKKTTDQINNVSSGLRFKIQIAALKFETADMNSEELRKIGSLSVKKQDDINKYLVGDFITRESAEIAREKLKNLGYKGAFLVPVND